MERFVLERKIPLDIWRELKTYLVHNIKTQAKHIKNKKSINNFNDALRQLPRIRPPPSGPKIVYNSAKKSYRIAKYIYHIKHLCHLLNLVRLSHTAMENIPS